MSTLYEVVVSEKRKKKSGEVRHVLLTGKGSMLLFAESTADAERQAIVDLTLDQKIRKENVGEITVMVRAFQGSK